MIPSLYISVITLLIIEGVQKGESLKTRVRVTDFCFNLLGTVAVFRMSNTTSDELLEVSTLICEIEELATMLLAIARKWILPPRLEEMEQEEDELIGEAFTLRDMLQALENKLTSHQPVLAPSVCF
jgi:hypothetical protein